MSIPDQFVHVVYILGSIMHHQQIRTHSSDSGTCICTLVYAYGVRQAETNYRLYLSNNLPKQSLSNLKEQTCFHALVKLRSQMIAFYEPEFLAHQT